jgi:phosphate transport system substrate-binding protein
MTSKVVFTLAVVLTAACAFAKDSSIQVKGSDTMVNLGQAWAEGYMEKAPGEQVAVTGGGSGTGFASLISGSCDIAMSSRTIKPKEIEQSKAKGFEPKEIQVALDGIAIVVNPKNPVAKLTFAQLADIFTGRVANWQQVGGANEKIVLLSREVNSGTHVYFKEHVLRKGDPNSKEEFSPSALMLPSSQAIADEVAANPAAIGYYGMGYISAKQKTVAVAKDENAVYELPTMENVIKGSYPISRPLFLYSKGEPQGAVKKFVDFCLSPEGQVIVKKTDFVPIQ